MLNKTWIVTLWLLLVCSISLFSSTPKFLLNKLQNTNKDPQFLPSQTSSTYSQIARNLADDTINITTSDSLPVKLMYMNYLLMGTTLFGDWNGSQIPSFKNQGGFAFFNYLIDYSFEDYFAFDLYLYDGSYTDSGSAHISFLESVNGISQEDYSNESGAVTITNTTVYISTQDSRTSTGNKQLCLTNATFYFVDLRTNQGFKPTFETDEDASNLAVKISLESTNCSLSFSTSIMNHNTGFNDLEAIMYAFLMTTGAIVQAVVCNLLVRAAERGDPSVKKVSLGTLRILNAFDFYLCMLGLDKFITSATVTGLTALPYGILALHYEFLLILHTSNAQTQLPSEDSAKLKSLNCLWLVYSLGSLVASVYMEDPTYIYLAFALAQLPQIIQNLTLKRRCKLNFWILFPLSLPKLGYLFYVLNDENNLFRSTPNPEFFTLITILVFIQFLILIIQSRVAFFAKRTDIFYQFNNEPDKEVTGDVCSICLENLSPEEINQVQQNQEEGKDKALLTVIKNPMHNESKPQIIVTPCKHQFHESCLRNWTKFKYECPCCRFNLPALPGDDE